MRHLCLYTFTNTQDGGITMIFIFFDLDNTLCHDKQEKSIESVYGYLKASSHSMIRILLQGILIAMTKYGMPIKGLLKHEEVRINVLLIYWSTMILEIEN